MPNQVESAKRILTCIAEEISAGTNVRHCLASSPQGDRSDYYGLRWCVTRKEYVRVVAQGLRVNLMWLNGNPGP